MYPFLSTSYPAAKKLGSRRTAIEKKLASQGLMLLFAVPWGPQALCQKDLATVEV